MFVDDKRDTTVVFTDDEMNDFDDDAHLALTDGELSSRMGTELFTVSVLIDIDNREDTPPYLREHHEDYTVFADKLNPTQLIIDSEYEKHYFRIVRPKDLSMVGSILEQKIADDEYNRELDEDFERERQQRERDDLND